MNTNETRVIAAIDQKLPALPAVRLDVLARKAGALGLPTRELTFYGADRDEAWASWVQFSEENGLEWMPGRGFAG